MFYFDVTIVVLTISLVSLELFWQSTPCAIHIGMSYPVYIIYDPTYYKCCHFESASVFMNSLSSTKNQCYNSGIYE